MQATRWVLPQSKNRLCQDTLDLSQLQSGKNYKEHNHPLRGQQPLCQPLKNTSQRTSEWKTPLLTFSIPPSTLRKLLMKFMPLFLDRLLKRWRKKVFLKCDFPRVSVTTLYSRLRISNYQTMLKPCLQIMEIKSKAKLEWFQSAGNQGNLRNLKESKEVSKHQWPSIHNKLTNPRTWSIRTTNFSRLWCNFRKNWLSNSPKLTTFWPIWQTKNHATSSLFLNIPFISLKK